MQPINKEQVSRWKKVERVFLFYAKMRGRHQSDKLSDSRMQEVQAACISLFIRIARMHHLTRGDVFFSPIAGKAALDALLVRVTDFCAGVATEDPSLSIAQCSEFDGLIRDANGSCPDRNEAGYPAPQSSADPYILAGLFEQQTLSITEDTLEGWRRQIMDGQTVTLPLMRLQLGWTKFEDPGKEIPDLSGALHFLERDYGVESEQGNDSVRLLRRFQALHCLLGCMAWILESHSTFLGSSPAVKAMFDALILLVVKVTDAHRDATTEVDDEPNQRLLMLAYALCKSKPEDLQKAYDGVGESEEGLRRLADVLYESRPKDLQKAYGAAEAGKEDPLMELLCAQSGVVTGVGRKRAQRPDQQAGQGPCFFQAADDDHVPSLQACLQTATEDITAESLCQLSSTIPNLEEVLLLRACLQTATEDITAESLCEWRRAIPNLEEVLSLCEQECGIAWERDEATAAAASADADSSWELLERLNMLRNMLRNRLPDSPHDRVFA